MISWFPSFALVALTALASQIEGHRPAATEPGCGIDYGSSETALQIIDASISWGYNYYLDCTNRAVWSTFQNPSEDFSLYFGVLTPQIDRFADVRADAMLIGPGFPSLTDEQWAKVPDAVREDPIWNDETIGALLFEGTSDVSNCDFLGKIMQFASVVEEGRCTFNDWFGQDTSWPLLDQDDIIIPVANATYYSTVWLKEDTSAKLRIAIGTWVEDFKTPFDVDEPSCQRNLGDFHEQLNDQSLELPYVQCSEIEGPVDLVVEEAKVCGRGAVCETSDNCVTDGVSYTKPSMVCGGERCPLQTSLWQEVNMWMMVEMMDIDYTGDANIDFVRGMIPHHLAAVKMCEVLFDVTCTESSDIENLDGLSHLCSHIKIEQEREVGGMRAWLARNGISEKAPCNRPISRMAHATSQVMIDSCGSITVQASADFIDINHQMHTGMAIDVSCDPSTDFVRGMVPHHEGAIAMCDVLMETTTDSYLTALCSNITYTQYAEVAWMHEWMSNRGLEMYATCSDCDEMMDEEMMASNQDSMIDFLMDETEGRFDKIMGSNEDQMGGDMGGDMMDSNGSMLEAPCEDLLPTTTFCHKLGADGYCRCSELIEVNDCGTSFFVPGVGLLDVDEQCSRTCGFCPARLPLFHYVCDAHGGHGDHMGQGGHNHDEWDDDYVYDGLESAGSAMKARFVEVVFAGAFMTLFF